MPVKPEPLESYYASNTLGGLIRSGLALLTSRRVRPRSSSFIRRLHTQNLLDYTLYLFLIIVPAIILNTFQHLRTFITGKPRQYPNGSWQFYLQTGLREDAAHHTNETIGYEEERPADAAELDDLTGWVMAVIQFLWNYDELIGVTWDEWTMLRLIKIAAIQCGMTNHKLFKRLQRQWEMTRPYTAPLNGTYADIRQEAFDKFIQPRLEVLPPPLSADIIEKHAELAKEERVEYQAQMSLLATLEARRYIDKKQTIPLWAAAIGVVIKGQYYLINITDHYDEDTLIVYDLDGQQTLLKIKGDRLVLPDGNQTYVERNAVYRVSDATLVGYLDMAPAARVKWQIREILAGGDESHNDVETDILLAETPRTKQKQLRKLLPQSTQASLEALTKMPILINWDKHEQELTLAEIRQTHRGIGDHPLTIIRTESSFVFDHSHVFFDGTWSLAVAEVLTNTAIQWCKRCMTFTPSQTIPAQKVPFEASSAFTNAASTLRRSKEIAAETTIWDNSNIFALRKLLAENGTSLTINDLLVITRLFHAAHYQPNTSIQEDIDELRKSHNPGEQKAARAISRSLERGRVTNPALLIPVDASPTTPRERIFPITFRNLADNLVRIWDDTIDAYQEYRRIEPPNTPEGLEKFQEFAKQRKLLMDNLRAFSYILDANKAVAIRGHSFNIAVLKLLVGLPLWLQILLKEIPENFLALNEILRGDEVYSNVGRVAYGSSLSRFMTAKDDGNTKALAWGVMSDDNGRLIVTMRDFRPHVEPLQKSGHEDLAARLAQDYVSAYTTDLIGLVARLSAMLQAETPHQLNSRATL